MKEATEQSRRRAGMVLTDKDRKILALTAEYRFLTADLIWRLLRDDDPGPLEYKPGKDGKKRPTQYGFGTQALYKRLLLLSKGGFLVPHRLTDRAYGGTDGSPRQVYHIGSAAVAPLAEYSGQTPDQIRQIVEANKKVKVPFMRHALEIATFRAALVLGTRASQGKVKLTYWEQGSRLRDFAEGRSDEGDIERFSVYPDAFFGLWVQGKGHANHFLEVDRGTMPIVATHNKPDIRKKLLGFAHYKELKAHSRKYAFRLDHDGIVSGAVISDNPRRGFPEHLGLKPMKGFTVLFLMPKSDTSNGAPSRIDNVLAGAATCGTRFLTSRHYWFAPFDAFSLDEPLSVFSRYWRTTNPTLGLQSLIEGDDTTPARANSALSA